jgi:hypothetical protein
MSLNVIICVRLRQRKRSNFETVCASPMHQVHFSTNRSNAGVKLFFAATMTSNLYPKVISAYFVGLQTEVARSKVSPRGFRRDIRLGHLRCLHTTEWFSLVLMPSVTVLSEADCCYTISLSAVRQVPGRRENATTLASAD